MGKALGCALLALFLLGCAPRARVVYLAPLDASKPLSIRVRPQILFAAFSSGKPRLIRIEVLIARDPLNRHFSLALADDFSVLSQTEWPLRGSWSRVIWPPVYWTVPQIPGAYVVTGVVSQFGGGQVIEKAQVLVVSPGAKGG